MQRCIWNSGGPDRCTQNSEEYKLYCLFHENEYKNEYKRKYIDAAKKVEKDTNRIVLITTLCVILMCVVIYFMAKAGIR